MPLTQGPKPLGKDGNKAWRITHIGSQGSSLSAWSRRLRSILQAMWLGPEAWGMQHNWSHRLNLNTPLGCRIWTHYWRHRYVSNFYICDTRGGKLKSRWLTIFLRLLSQIEPWLVLGPLSCFQWQMTVKEGLHKNVSPKPSWRTAAGGNTPSLAKWH